MSLSRLERQIAFLAQADALKSVERQSRIVGGSRRENSAEHSWHLALFALVLGADHPAIDTARVVARLLVHDLVEIDAGDTPIHSASCRRTSATGSSPCGASSSGRKRPTRASPRPSTACSRRF